jgi:hypothetical protein
MHWILRTLECRLSLITVPCVVAATQAPNRTDALKIIGLRDQATYGVAVPA